jgi:hypothetical protein
MRLNCSGLLDHCCPQFALIERLQNKGMTLKKILKRGHVAAQKQLHPGGIKPNRSFKARNPKVNSPV